MDLLLINLCYPDPLIPANVNLDHGPKWAHRARAGLEGVWVEPVPVSQKGEGSTHLSAVHGWAASREPNMRLSCLRAEGGGGSIGGGT